MQLTANSGQGRSVTSIPMRAPLVRRRRKRHVPGQQLCGVGLERLTRSIRLPDGGGRHPTANVPGNSAAHRGTATAATTSASVTCSMGMRPRATDGRGVSQCQAKMARSDPRPPVRAARGAGSRPHLASALQERRKSANIHASSGGIRRIPAQTASCPPSPCCGPWTVVLGAAL